LWQYPDVGRRARAERVVFLLAAVVRANFADVAERRWRLIETYLLLAGRKTATARETAMIDRELAKQ
jgi:hypothetical protein